MRPHTIMSTSCMKPGFTLLAVAAVAALAAGCGGSLVEGKKVDYKSAAKTRPLEVPPDIAAPATSDRYTLPDAPSRATATYSEYAQDRPGRSQLQGVLPAVGGAHIERGGTQRWLVVDQPPEAVWPVLREFWQELGFIVATDNPQIGVMETDWAENRAKIPQSFLRNAIGKVFEQAYSAPERDRFRTRIERGADGKTTEVYVSHQGAFEMYVADANMRQTGRTVWQPRPADPDLEAEMLRRLMVKLGTSPDVAAAEVRAAQPEVRAALSKVDGQPVLTLKDDFDRGWRRVGLSLDRLGFAVQDRDRADGLYYVRYLNPEEVREEGWLSKLAFWSKDDPAAKAADYRIAVEEAQDGSRVTIQSGDGKPENSEVATRILTVLLEDLK
jgi:outer membrane protein assembly factor BamC